MLNPERENGKYAYTQNRELSWLRFNRRVLEEAGDDTVPLLERLKFISIFTSNLDEFFMVRVGNLFDLSLVKPGDIDNKTGETPREQLEEVYNVIPGLIEIKNRLYTNVDALLRQQGICDLTMEELSPEEKKYVNTYYKARILPVLSPQIVDSHHPFPHLANKALYVAALLRNRKGSVSLGFVPVPASLPRFLLMPGDPCRFIRMETVALHQARNLFGDYVPVEFCIVCATRNADIDLDRDMHSGIHSDMVDNPGEDLRSQMSKLLKQRAKLSVVRLELDRKVSVEFLKLLKSRAGVENRQIYIDQAPLEMKYVYDLVKELPEEKTAALSFPDYQPRWPEDLEPKNPKDPKTGIISQIRRKDRLLFFPFDSVDPFLQLLKEAADRPDVISIRITIYRLASSTSSAIARTLCRAAENGKEVTVLMELRARFDEANNISWSRLLEDAGCQVIYGVEDYKCHSKICLITMRHGDKLSYITQIGTGNYNERTNAMYTDLSLMTADQRIGLDGTVFFQNMLIGNLEGSYNHLNVAPSGLKPKLLELIDGEIAKGQEGYICIKANAVTEREVMDKLSEASCAGVQIQLIIRGICCLRPGIPAKTENVHVTSIVGRYLEHGRIYCFGQGASAKWFIASADMMTRNLTRRVEIMCPVYDPEIKKQLQWILRTQLKDNVKASSLLPDGSYCRKVNTLTPCSSQEVFMAQTVHHPLPKAPERRPKGIHILFGGLAGKKRGARKKKY
ncbi:MAG: polyphosphate kinase 1 [Oscillospiraceae bacterium]|nr:polyphosphate kinase 1 [Oscillospiraceae bacterium]